MEKQSDAVSKTSCRGQGRGRASWLAPRRVWLWSVTGLAIVAGAGFALSQNWITASNLLLLLLVLPCAAMMFMCMKGMRHGKHDSEAQSPTRGGRRKTDAA